MKKIIAIISCLAIILSSTILDSNKVQAQENDSYWSLGMLVSLPGEGTVFVCMGAGWNLCKVSGPIIKKEIEAEN